MTQSTADRSGAPKAIAHATAAETGHAYAVHLRTGHHVFAADEPLTSGGADTAPNPMQLALGGLCACTAITLRMYAQRHGWAIGTIQVQVQLVQAGDRRSVERVVRIEGGLDDEQHARLAEIAEKTPVTLLFKHETPITTEFVR
jgi:putative redox protein